MLKATGQLHRLGQSLWLDNITRDLLTSGTLQHYIDDLSVTGLTSNPTIFEQAIKNSAAYDTAIAAKLGQGKSGEALFFELALEDLTRAADLFRPDLRSDQRHGRMGVARGLAAAGPRHRRDHRGRQGSLFQGRSSEPDDQDPGTAEGCRRSRRPSSPASRSTSRCSSRASTTSPPPKRSCAASNAGSTPG